MMHSLHLLLLGIIAVRNCHGTSLAEVFAASKEAVDSGKPQANVDVLQKYYFTNTKDDSVWYVAQRDARKIYNIDIGIDHLQFLEKLIKRVGNHFELCLSIAGGSVKAQCFAEFGNILRDIEKGAEWDPTVDVSLESKSKYGTLYLCVAVMNTHLILITNDVIKSFDEKSLDAKMKPLIQLREYTISKLYEYNRDVTTWRIDQIGPAELCELNTYFWKDFEGTCETRWQYDKVIGPKNISSTVPATSRRDNVPSKDEEVQMHSFDPISKKQDYKSTEKESILAIVDRIGGASAINQRKFRVQLYDSAEDRIIYEQTKVADVSMRGDVMNILAEKALLSRAVQEKRVKKMMDKFVKKTSTVVSMILEKSNSYLG